MKVTATGTIAQAALEDLLYMDTDFEGELTRTPRSTYFKGSKRVPKFKDRDRPYHKPKATSRTKPTLKDLE